MHTWQQNQTSEAFFFNGMEDGKEVIPKLDLAVPAQEKKNKAC